MTFTGSDILALETLSARAWPAARRADLGGWRLNAASGFSGRVNACWPLGDPGVALDEAIAHTEAWYADQGLPCRFKSVAAACVPAALPARLADLGYRPGAETIMMIGRAGGSRDASVLLRGTVEADFAAVFTTAADGPGDARERLEILARVPAPRAFALAGQDGEPAAVGASAAEGEWAGVFAMRTGARFRRRGLARRVLASLMAFAADGGAQRAWLQVEADNAGAIALYRAAGFTDAYRYRYWMRPTADPA